MAEDGGDGETGHGIGCAGGGWRRDEGIAPYDEAAEIVQMMIARDVGGAVPAAVILVRREVGIPPVGRPTSPLYKGGKSDAGWGVYSLIRLASLATFPQGKALNDLSVSFADTPLKGEAYNPSVTAKR